MKGDKVEHARIGVTVGPAIANDDITGIGAEVKEVTKGSAGDDAGLEKGDIITAVNDHPIVSSNALVAAIRGYQPGETITLTYLRDGERGPPRSSSTRTAASSAAEADAVRNPRVDVRFSLVDCRCGP